MSFKINDRVKVYDIDSTMKRTANFDRSFVPEPSLIFDKGRVVLVGQHHLLVSTDRWGTHWWTKKQCRRLKLKARPRYVIVEFGMYGTPKLDMIGGDWVPGERVRFEGGVRLPNSKGLTRTKQAFKNFERIVKGD